VGSERRVEQRGSAARPERQKRETDAESAAAHSGMAGSTSEQTWLLQEKAIDRVDDLQTHRERLKAVWMSYQCCDVR